MTGTATRRITVFCGSSTRVSPELMEEGNLFGQLCARNGLTVIYGGGSNGLMGTCAAGARSEGGEVITIIPELLVRHSGDIDRNREDTIICTSMSERKDMMIRDGDIFAVLPGGIGTIDEMIEVMTLNQIGFIDKKLIIINKDGFWNPFLATIDAMIGQAFCGQDVRDRLLVYSDSEAAFADRDRWLA